MVNAILVIARNALPLTRNALRTFLAQDIGDVQVLMLDNACTDGSTEWMHTLDERVLVAHFTQPKSVAACWNFGLRWWFERGAKHVLVCNNDVEIRPDTYSLLVEDGGGFATGVGVNTREQAFNVPFEKKVRQHPDFSNYLIRREVFDRVQFDEAYQGGYCEDSEFHLALYRTGIPAYCIGVPFYHVASGTMKYADEAEQERIRKNADRNRALFKQRHGCEVGSTEYYAFFGDSKC